MPLLEINQVRHICASVRLDEDYSCCRGQDKYAAFIHASADDVVDKALNYVFSKGPRHGTSEDGTRQAGCPRFACAKKPDNGATEQPTKKQPGSVTASVRAVKA